MASWDHRGTKINLSSEGVFCGTVNGVPFECSSLPAAKKKVESLLEAQMKEKTEAVVDRTVILLGNLRSRYSGSEPNDIDELIVKLSNIRLEKPNHGTRRVWQATAVRVTEQTTCPKGENPRYWRPRNSWNVELGELHCVDHTPENEALFRKLIAERKVFKDAAEKAKKENDDHSRTVSETLTALPAPAWVGDILKRVK